MSESTSNTVAAAELRKPRFRLDNRYIAPLFITFILLVGHLSYGILESYPKTALAIVTALVTELILGRIFYGKWLNLASAYISGISVGMIVRSPAFWPFALCSAVSIMSKYVLRIKGRHLWNPSNFGLSVLFFLGAETVAGLSIQWGNFIWAHARDLDFGLDNHLSSSTFSHQRHLRYFLFCVCISSQLDHWRSVGLGDLADYWSDVSAVCVLHDHGSEDNSEDEAWAVHRRLPGGLC